MRAPYFLLVPAALWGMSQAPNPPRVVIPRLAGPPSMVADMDLSSWSGAAEITEFRMNAPDDSGENRWPTKAWIVWGPDALYVAFDAMDPDPSRVRGFPHRRDDSSGDQDMVGLDLDPTGQGQMALRFLVTPTGGQIDELIRDGSGEDPTYDCLWDSIGFRTERGYFVKIRIPYTSLRRTPGAWGLRLLRFIPRERRYGISWPRVSRDVQCDLCQMAKVAGAPVGNSGTPFLFIPFMTATRGQSSDTGIQSRPSESGQMGADLRFSTAAATFEGTFRPDFNSVDRDVDPLQVNSRFNVLYPERRPFFLEGMDLLGTAGAQQQFYSRSIQDPLYGVKVSGSAGLVSWSALRAQDRSGGAMLDSSNPVASTLPEEGLSTSDTVAGLRMRTDDQGSGITVLGTSKQLIGGPAGAGGSSGGLYVTQHLGSEFQIVLSDTLATAHLPGPEGDLTSHRGDAYTSELDWSNRNWHAYLSFSATSPDLVLASGFTDLTGYRRRSFGFGWHEQWNDKPISRLSISCRNRSMTYWDGQGLDHVTGVQVSLETSGRFNCFLSWDPFGRTWASDGGPACATRSGNLYLQWSRWSWFQPFFSQSLAKTMDLDSLAKARSRSNSLGVGGNLAGLGYNIQAEETEVNRAADGLRFIRARELVGTLTWQLPLHFYAHTQVFGVHYDGAQALNSDKFLKVLAGWQPNAFTNSFLGWSGRRKWDPASGLLDESMIDRAWFAKVSFAFQL
jgi:hypothetical protein